LCLNLIVWLAISLFSPKASHAARCRHEGDMTRRHNGIRNILFGLASNAKLAPIKEKAKILPTQPTRRPGDVYIPQFLAGKAAALDVAITCPVQAKYASGNKVAVEDYALNIKHKTYDPGFVGTDVEFYPVVVDTFGKWGEEALEVIKELVIRGYRQTEVPFNTYGPQAWQKLSVALQKCNAGMVLSRMAPVQVY